MKLQTGALIIVALIIGIIVGTQTPGLLSQFQADDQDTNSTIIEEVLAGPVFPPENGVINIGYIVPSTANLETCVPFFKQIVEPDINKYVASLGHNYTFNFVMETADGQAAVHLEKVQYFKYLGIDVFLGGLWSSQAHAALDYVNENDMLMVSPTARSPLLAIPNDRLYRTCPTDNDMAPVLAEMLDSWGTEAIIIFQMNNSWANGLYDVFENEWLGKGKEMLDRVVYHAEVTEFSSQLERMNTVVSDNIDEYGYEQISVLSFSYDELSNAMEQVSDYPDAGQVIWMGTDTALMGCGGTSIKENHIKLGQFHPNISPSNNPGWESLNTRFYDLVSQPASFYTGSKYDAAWLIALSIIQAQSTNATIVSEVFPVVAENYYGVGGVIQLDENGDRISTSYEVSGFFSRDGNVGFQPYGYVDGVSGTVIWDFDALSEQGFELPG